MSISDDDDDDDELVVVNRVKRSVTSCSCH